MQYLYGKFTHSGLYFKDKIQAKKTDRDFMKKICEMCSGTGQISFFKGVSRFLLSVEDCPECGGLGYMISSDEGSGAEEKNVDNCDETGKKGKE